MTDWSEWEAWPQPFSLRGRRIAVTGAGRGLGAATAQAIAAAGATVVLGVRQMSAGDDVIRAIEHSGGTAMSLHLDVRSTSSADDFMAASGQLDGLVNNAGIAHSSPVVDLDDEHWSDVIDVNLTGTFRCSRAFLRTAGPGSSIVNVASIASTVGVPSEVAYAASKGGVAALTRTLALEAARKGVRVNAIAPGYFATDMPKAVLDDPKSHERLLSSVPLRRIAAACEIGPPIVFLLSAAAAFMTGTVLPFDGGFTAR